MPIAKIVAGAIAKYPYTREDLQADHPNTCFMSPLVPAALDEFGVAEVALVNKPAADSGYKVVEGTPALVNGAWTQTWEQVELTPEEIAAKVPRIVTKRQGMAELIERDLLATVQSILDGIQGKAGVLARNDFNNSQEWQRDWPLIAQLQPILGWSDAFVDELFTSAKDR